MRVRNTKVTRRQRFLTSSVAGGAVVIFVAALAAVRGEDLLAIMFIVLVGCLFIPGGMWVSDRLWGKAEDDS